MEIWEAYIRRKEIQLAITKYVHRNIQTLKEMSDEEVRLKNLPDLFEHKIFDPVFDKIGETWGYFSENIHIPFEDTEEFRRMSGRVNNAWESLSKRRMTEGKYNHFLNSSVEDIVSEFIGRDVRQLQTVDVS